MKNLPTVSSSSDKHSLRETLKNRIRSLNASEHENASGIIRQRLSDLIRRENTVLGFWPLASEPNLKPLLTEWIKTGFRICLPKVEGTRLKAYRTPRIDCLVDSQLGVEEPDPSICQEIHPSKINVILVPGIGFSAKGDRLGRGGGYYDRYLEMIQSHTHCIGVAFQIQIEATIPTEPHDVRVRSIITN